MTRRLRCDDGANAVEFALVLPMLVLLIFGAISAGLALNSRQQLDHAAREGVRYAATLPDADDGTATPCGGASTWFQCVRDRTIGTSVGTINHPGGDGAVCVSHIAEDGTTTTRLYGPIEDSTGSVGDDTDDGVSSSDPCFVESPALDGARVQVVAEAPARVNAVFMRTSLFDLSARSVARYEEAS